MFRDQNFDLTPAHSLEVKEKLADTDTSYFEMKELSKMLQSASKSLQFQFTTDFINEYGTQEEVEAMQIELV